MASRKFYVVWEGRAPGIYDSWEEAKDQIQGFPGAKYKAFPTQEEATTAFRGDPKDQLYALRAIAKHDNPTVNYEAFPEIRMDAMAVDAACSGNPGVMEYRGVWVATGEEIFHFGPVPKGTNNIGEFLALVHALALCKQKGWSMPIYSDSVLAQGWIKKRMPKTTLPLTPETQKLHQLLARGTNWLKENTWTNPILKWDTEKWGEIPADFGRK